MPAPDTLIEELNRGDEAAAERAFRQFEPFLRRLVRRRLPAEARSRFDSCDIVQSVWAGLLVGLRDARWRFPDAARLRAFLARAALCRLYDRAGQVRAQRAREQPLPELGRDLPGGEPRPSAYARADDVWQSLLTACPPEHRPVLHLRRLGHDCDEIAARTGLHPGSVRRILRHLASRVAFAAPTPPAADAT